MTDVTIVPWDQRPKIDELLSTDLLMRRLLSGAVLNQEIPVSDLQIFLQGLPIVNIKSATDLPILANGVSTLEQGKNYDFLEPFAVPDPISIPAGWVGRVRSNFLTSNFIDYAGISPMFSTLNIDGIIGDIQDNGSGGIIVTTIGAHGLLDGQFVNLTGTVAYNQDRLVISNKTNFSFDVQIAFVGTEITGAFNTGYGSVIFNDFIATNAGTADFMDLTAAPILGSTLSLDGVTEFGFLSPGIVRNAPSVIIDKTILGFLTDGLTLQDCDTIGITSSNLQSLSDLFSTSRGLILTGALTRVFGIFGSSFTLLGSNQRPVRVDSSINAARQILFQNTPDNGIADDYFDTSLGGLDQTNPQVLAINNGLRPNSMTISESTTTRLLEVDGSGGGDVPIVDILPLTNDWAQDPSTEEFSLDTLTGLTTYDGLVPFTGMIKFSLGIAQESGSNQTVVIDLHINGLLQAKSSIIIVTTGAGTFIQGVYNGGNFLINPGDTFQLFKNNTTNTSNTDVENPTLLINRVSR